MPAKPPPPVPPAKPRIAGIVVKAPPQYKVPPAKPRILGIDVGGAKAAPRAAPKPAPSVAKTDVPPPSPETASSSGVQGPVPGWVPEDASKTSPTSSSASAWLHRAAPAPLAGTFADPATVNAALLLAGQPCLLLPALASAVDSQPATASISVPAGTEQQSQTASVSILGSAPILVTDTGAHATDDDGDDDDDDDDKEPVAAVAAVAAAAAAEEPEPVLEQVGAHIKTTVTTSVGTQVSLHNFMPEELCAYTPRPLFLRPPGKFISFPTYYRMLQDDQCPPVTNLYKHARQEFMGAVADAWLNDRDRISKDGVTGNWLLKYP